MRFKTLILLLLLTTTLQAQPHRRSVLERIPEPVKVITLYTGAIVLDAVGDGLYDDGNKTWGHALQSASTGLLLTAPFVFDVDRDTWYWYLASYVCLRIALFDPVYNTTRGLPLGYVGNTSLWDKGMQKFAPPEGIKVFGHSVFFMIGVAIPICEL